MRLTPERKTELAVADKKPLTPRARLTLALGKYYGSRIERENSRHCDRMLRALDGLRDFRDLPPQPTAVANAMVETRTRHLAHHRIGGGIF